MMEDRQVSPTIAGEDGIKADGAVDEAKHAVEYPSDSKVSQALSPKYSSKVADIDTEVSKMKAALDSKEQEITTLRAELSEKEVTLRALEADVERGRESERKLLDSLEETKILVEESKMEIMCLKERLDGSVHSQDSSEDDSSIHECDNVESLKLELESTKESLARAHETAQASSVKLLNVLEEMSSVKNELKLATEAELTSKKAMDDLVLALTEVATDGTQAKEKLVITEMQLEAERSEAEQLKEKLAATEENYKTLLQEARKEAELHKNTTERLRIEAEESLLAWNGKEAVFVSCIKRGEDEKNSLLDENDKLLQALMAAENQSKKAKDENHKVRDILKQAINEANVAKEAGGIARAENSQLKDALMDKEEELKFALQEIERLRLIEASANENIKNLKRLLYEAAEKEKHSLLSRQNSSGSSSKNLSRQNSMQKDQEVEKKSDEREQQSDKKEEKKEHRKDKKEHHKDHKKEHHHEKKEHHKDHKKDHHHKDKKEQHSDKKEDKKEHHHKDKKEQTQQIDKKIGKTCSFSLRDLKISQYHKHKDINDEETTKAPTINNQQDCTEDVESEANSPGSGSDLFKGSIFDVAETPHAAAAVTHHRRRSSCTFLEDGEPMNSEDLDNLDCNHTEEGESEKGARKKKAFIRRFGDLLVRRKSFSHKKEPSFDQQEKHQQPSTPTPTTTPTQSQPQSPEHQ